MKNQDHSSNIAVTLTAKDAFCDTISLEDASVFLSRIRLESAINRIVLLIHINEKVFLDNDIDPHTRLNHTRKLFNFLFNTETSTKLFYKYSKEEAFRPLSNQALFATLRLALTKCNKNNGQWITDENPIRYNLSHIILSFQSVLLSPELQDIVLNDVNPDHILENHYSEFIKNSIAHEELLYSRNAMGRLYAIATIDEISRHMYSKCKLNVHDLFNKYFRMSPIEYFYASFLICNVTNKLDISKPNSENLWFRSERHWSTLEEPYLANTVSLFKLASQKLNKGKMPDCSSMYEFLYDSTDFFSRPILDLGEISICVSPDLLLKKFLFGLPYLAQEVTRNRLDRNLTNKEVKHCRGYFGNMFEGYVHWIINRFFPPNTDYELIFGFNYGDNNREMDVAIIVNEKAIVIEAKTCLATLKLRKSGKFENYSKDLIEGSKNAYHASHAIRNNMARRANGKTIEGVRWVIPCVLTYDQIHINNICASYFEKYIEENTDLPLFLEKEGVEALQFLSIDIIEDIENKIGIANPSMLFGQLCNRTRKKHLRYRPLHAQDDIETRITKKPFDDIVNASKKQIDSISHSFIRKDK